MEIVAHMLSDTNNLSRMLAVGLAGLVAACGTETGPPTDQEPRRPQLAISSGAWGDSYYVSPTSETDSITFTFANNTYETLYDVLATGTLSYYYNDDQNWTQHWPNPGSKVADLDPAGFWVYSAYCQGGVYVGFTGGTTSTGAPAFCYYPGSPRPFDVSIVGYGIGTVHWSNVTGPAWCGGQCFTGFTGGYLVQIEKVEATMTFSPERVSVLSGLPLTVSANVAPASSHGMTVPRTIFNWKWKPKNSSVVDLCYGSAPLWLRPEQCSFTPAKSGWLWIEAVVNGTLGTDSVQVDLFPCLTGNPTLDDPLIREGLREAFNNSGYPGSAGADRLERGGGLHCDANGCSPVLYPPGANDGPCDFLWSDKTNPSPGALSVAWHIHPFRPADSSDPLPSPSVCPYRNPNRPPPSGPRRSAFGPSFPNDFNAPIPTIVVDPSYVYLLPANADNPLDTQWFPRTGVGSCDVLAAPVT